MNPTPKDRCNLVVLGGGTAGLVAAAGAAGLGHGWPRRAPPARRRLLVTGCVPSKALIRSARAAANARRASALGVQTGEVTVDFPAVMARMRALRAGSRATIRRSLPGSRRGRLPRRAFASPTTLEVGGETLRFARAVIATGACAAMPPIPGLAEAGVLTHRTLFSLEISRPGWP